MRESVFINCWHRNRDDSAAMWALYGKSACAVALTTTVGQLADTVAAIAEHRISIARVEYVVVPIDASRLLRSIVIAPDAPPWFEISCGSRRCATASHAGPNAVGRVRHEKRPGVGPAWKWRPGSQAAR